MSEVYTATCVDELRDEILRHAETLSLNELETFVAYLNDVNANCRGRLYD